MIEGAITRYVAAGIKELSLVTFEKVKVPQTVLRSSNCHDDGFFDEVRTPTNQEA